MKRVKGKKQRLRWSAVDTLILLLVLVTVAGFVYRVVDTANKDMAREPVRYRVYFDVMETHADVLAEIQGFDPVYLYENDAFLGQIGVYQDQTTGEQTVALTVTPAPETAWENRATATGCMVCSNATISPGGGLRVENSGRLLVPGSVLEVRTDRVLMTIRITSIREYS